MGLIWLLVIFSNAFTLVETDPCQIYGTVYIEKNKSYANYLVFEDDSGAFADVLVFKQENKLFADDSGLWHFTDDKSLADFTIYLTPKKNQADFSIFYIDKESFAGCN